MIKETKSGDRKMSDPILFQEVSEALFDTSDWIRIWLKAGYTKEGLVGIFKEIVEEIEDENDERQ